MSWITDLLLSYRRFTAPVIAVLVGVPIIYLSMLVPSLGDIIFVIPVETYFVFHFLKIYKIKVKLLAGVIVFLALAMIASGIASASISSYGGNTGKETMTDGTIIQTAVTPYHGSYQTYNYSFMVKSNTSISPFWLNISSVTQRSFNLVVNESSFHQVTYSNGTILYYAHVTGFSKDGWYQYILQNSTYKTTNGTVYYIIYNTGPLVNFGSTTLYSYELVLYAEGYLILFTLIFLVGIFLGRSLSNSARYSRRSPPTPPEEPPQ